MSVSVTAELIGYASHEGVDLDVNVLVEEKEARCDGVLRAQVDVIVLEAHDHVLGHGMLDAGTDRPAVMPLAVARAAEFAVYGNTAHPADIHIGGHS